jgi:hypothetical protein
LQQTAIRLKAMSDRRVGREEPARARLNLVRYNRDGVPTVLRIRSYRFFFVSLDRTEPSHVHVTREKMVAKFWLEPVVLERAGGFSRVELNAIAKLVEEHRTQLLERWHEFFGR